MGRQMDPSLRDMSTTAQELVLASWKTFVIWWLSGIAGAFVFFTGVLQWVLAHLFGKQPPDWLRITLGGGLSVVFVAGSLASVLRVVAGIRTERDELRERLTPKLSVAFDPGDPLFLSTDDTNPNYEAQAWARLGIVNNGSKTADRVRLVIDWIEAGFVDMDLVHLPLRSHPLGEREFSVPASIGGRPSVCVELGELAVQEPGVGLRLTVENIGFADGPREIRVALALQSESGSVPARLRIWFDKRQLQFELETH